jgi:hypothetical protein
MSARWGYRVTQGDDEVRGYRDARTRSLAPRPMPSSVAAAIRFCVFDALIGRAPLLTLLFFLAWFCDAFNLGPDDPRAALTPTLMVAPGALLVVCMLATACVLALRRPSAPRFARVTKRWVRAHQVLVAIALPAWIMYVDGGPLAVLAFVVTLAVTRVVWSRSARLESAAVVCADSSDVDLEQRHPSTRDHAGLLLDDAAGSRVARGVARAIRVGLAMLPSCPRR